MSVPLRGMNRCSRRSSLQIGIASLAGSACADWLFAQQASVQSADDSPLNRFPRMMQDYLQSKVLAAQEKGDARRSALKSRSDAESYIANVRKLIRDSFGPFPEKTPLNPRITGIVERGQYRIEKVIFESRPGFLVTANLYVPKGKKPPFPGVVGSCGHSNNGKAAEAYQAFAQGLARLGYVVLIFDPIGQGERLQYPDATLKSKVGAGVDEHLLLGNQQFLVGEFFGTWRAWDGVRALDYLLTRPEVDSRHLGITGNSGGGTMTTWLCGLDSRWTMAAPSCFVTTFRRNFENELPADTEQCPPKALMHGLDHSDFLAVMAPKPVIILAAEKDYFDVRGAIEAYERLRSLYALLGAENNVRLFIGPNPHGFTQPNREAMYQFFNAQTGIEAAGKDQELTIESDKTLQCTSEGQVATMGSRTVVSFTAARSRELAIMRGELDADAIRQRVNTAIPERPGKAPDFQILRPVERRSYPKPHATWYAVETEPGTKTIAIRLSNKTHMSRPMQGPGRVVLFVAHHSSDVELRHEPLVKDLIKNEPQAELYAIDLRGIGDSQPQTCGANQFLVPYGSDYFYAAHSIMLGVPYPAQRAFDILRIVDWLKACGRTEIHLAALGWGTIPAALAAVISEDIRQVTLKRALTSWSQVAEADKYDWPLSALIPNVLQNFDLPDCYRFLISKNLKQIDLQPAHFE